MAQPSSSQQSKTASPLTTAPESRIRRGLTAIVLLGLTVGMFGLAIRVACLSGGVVKGPQGASLRDLYEEQHTARTRLPARRGNIFDCSGRLLGGTLQVPSIYADPGMIKDTEIETVAAKLGEILNIPAGEIATDLNKHKDKHSRFMWIQRHVPEEQADMVKALRLPGVVIESEPARIYPMGSTAAHVLGFVGVDQKGLSGLEMGYDKYLRGEDGYKICTTSAGRKILALEPNGYKPPRDGGSLVLSLDSYIQSVAEQAIAETVSTYQAQSAVAIVMEPSTGQVLALASYPTFDPNKYREIAESALINRALVGPVEPGSVFKPLVFSIAMQEGMVRPGEIFNCHNGVYIKGSRRLRDSHSYGNLTAEEVVAKSSNIGMAQIGERLGNHMMFHYLSQYGLGQKTGIDLAGEDVGILLPLRKWTSFSTDSVPMGQEVAVTPIQLLNAFNTVINGGTLVTPTLVRAVLAPEDGSVIVDRREPKKVRQVIDESVSKYMRNSPLTMVVNVGTGTKARLARWQVIGKTGTAQIARHGGGGYEGDAYVASFLCAAPADDPKVSVVVMVHRPKKSIGYYGGTVSAPPAAKILGTTLDYLGVPDDPVAPPGAASILAATGAGGRD